MTFRWLFPRVLYFQIICKWVRCNINYSTPRQASLKVLRENNLLAQFSSPRIRDYAGRDEDFDFPCFSGHLYTEVDRCMLTSSFTDFIVIIHAIRFHAWLQQYNSNLLVTVYTQWKWYIRRGKKETSLHLFQCLLVYDEAALKKRRCSLPAAKAFANE